MSSLFPVAAVPLRFPRQTCRLHYTPCHLLCFRKVASIVAVLSIMQCDGCFFGHHCPLRLGLPMNREAMGYCSITGGETGGKADSAAASISEMIVSKLFLASCTISYFSAKSVGLFKTIQNHWLKELPEFYSHIAKNGILHDSIIRSQGHKISALLILHHY